MDIFLGVLILVIINQLINVYVLNQVIKDRATLDAFVAAAKIYANAFEHLGVKYNELISMVNKHSDLLTELVDRIPEAQDATGVALEARQSGEKRARVSKRQSKNSTGTG